VNIATRARLPGTVLRLSSLAPALALALALAPAWPGAWAEDGAGGDGSGAEKPSYGALAELLEDESARNELIEELRRLAAGSPAPEGAGEVAGEAPPVRSLARRIADSTRGFAQDGIARINEGVAELAAVTRGSRTVDWSTITPAALDLLLVIAATLAGFFVLRRLVRPLFSYAGRWAARGTAGQRLARRALAVTASVVVDLLAIALAWVGGYAFALFVIGDGGSMSPRESLFLNAFLVVETFKALLRMVFAARDGDLRLVPVSGPTAAYWNTFLARLSGFIGYGILLLVPMINDLFYPALGRLAGTLVMVIAFLYALVVILRNRAAVRAQLLERARASAAAFPRVGLGMLARGWHVLAIVYFAALALAMLARPEDALPLMLKATAQTLAAIGAGLFLSMLLGQVIRPPVRVPETTRQRFPLLEQRLNRFVPAALKVVRLVIVLAVIGVVLDAWGLFNLSAWLASDAGLGVLGTALTVAAIVVVAVLVWIGLASWIEHRLNPDTGSGQPSAREMTLLSIFRNAVTVALSVMTLMIVLAEIGINIGPLLAGAGVLGLAIGFGAQKLVQDIITGIFLQLENAIHAGDVVTVAGTTGTAETLTIRSLGIRDLSGTYHIIPFSSVDSVSNYMRGFAYHVGDYGVAYREDTDEVIVKLREAFDELAADPEQGQEVIGELEVHGVTALADSSVNIRVRIKTRPGSQWSVGRAYNRLVKRHLDAAGIEIPYPHMTLYFGQDKDGSAPPAPVRLTEAAAARTEPPPAPTDSDLHPARSNPKPGEDFDED